MSFEDLDVGDVAGVRDIDAVRAEEMKLMSAIMGDSNPIHFDRRVVEKQGRPGLVNQGPINMSYVAQAVLAALESPTDLVSFSVRFQDAVHEGDDVTATATVAEKRVEDGDGFVEFDVELTREDTVVLSGSATGRYPGAGE